MARLAKLRWVPMLIRAYYDAQARVYSARESETADTAEQTPVKTKEKSSAPKKQTRYPNRPSNSQKLQPKPRHSMRQMRIKGDKTANLLREIRATNRKLEELADIRRQLKELGSSMEGVNRQIDALKARSETLVASSRSDSPPRPQWPNQPHP